MNKKEINYMQIIWEITEQLRTAQILEDALSESLKKVVKTLDAQAGTIWFLNEGDNRLYPTFNIGPVDISGISIENGQGIAGSVVASGEPVMVADCSLDKRFSQSVDKKTGFITRSLICVPLVNQYEVVGCIQIINKNDGSLYDGEDMKLCGNLASLIAIAVEERGLLVKINPHQKVLMSLKDVVKEFGSGENKVRVLKGVNLDVYEQELVVILGESGCGKSTMLNIIGGMDNLTSGSVMIEGEDFSAPSDYDLTMYRRKRLGFIFQSYNLMPNLTAKENLEFIGELCEDPMDAEEALKQVGLLERKHNYPAQMSGGQQQRVSIARAIIKKPKLILADEPTAALDFQTGSEVLVVLERILKERGTTIIMVTHNIEIAKMANRVVRMKNGIISDIQINMHPAKAADIVW